MTTKLAPPSPPYPTSIKSESKRKLRRLLSWSLGDREMDDMWHNTTCVFIVGGRAYYPDRGDHYSATLELDKMLQIMKKAQDNNQEVSLYIRANDTIQIPPPPVYDDNQPTKPNYFPDRSNIDLYTSSADELKQIICAYLQKGVRMKVTLNWTIWMPFRISEVPFADFPSIRSDVVQRKQKSMGTASTSSTYYYDEEERKVDW